MIKKKDELAEVEEAEREPEAHTPPAELGKKDECQTEDSQNLGDGATERSAQDEGYLAQLKRTQADLENLKKRTEAEKARIIESANENLMCGLLETLDNFERALVSMEESGSPDLEGVRMVHEGLMRALYDSGLERIEAKGRFDPRRHEAVMQTEVSDEAEDSTVLEEFQTGYVFRTRVIRPSRVRVARYVRINNKKDNNIKKEE
jgi:molecular chaperone GrpE